MKSVKKTRAAVAADIIGWREIVSLPELGVFDMRAKIDTGARTSALHAEEHEIFDRSGVRWVRFRVPASRHHRDFRVEVPVLDERDIKNTSGVPERRIVIRTVLHLGRHNWHVDVSLANRANMGFDMILGRTAIRRHNVLVDPGRSFLAGNPAPTMKH
ncbi:ATP-dependent zinc protease [Roseibium salinum]|uniref:RimK/LysX family protein n=1 Tax=Roseibium salinum TaxID=1604349 RepID=A0ABT3QYK3_9HYPH|nr:RimK/LysX family protein [Roseibium sp. DSM 29163]MCX2722002.1 RimK/LysX family protein [Roseibium sp. DSM 29163]